MRVRVNNTLAKLAMAVLRCETDSSKRLWQQAGLTTGIWEHVINGSSVGEAVNEQP